MVPVLRSHELLFKKKMLSNVANIIILLLCMYKLGDIIFHSFGLPFWVCMIKTCMRYSALCPFRDIPGLLWISVTVKEIDNHVHICNYNSRFNADIYIYMYILKFNILRVMKKIFFGIVTSLAWCIFRRII